MYIVDIDTLFQQNRSILSVGSKKDLHLMAETQWLNAHSHNSQHNLDVAYLLHFAFNEEIKVKCPQSTPLPCLSISNQLSNFHQVCTCLRKYAPFMCRIAGKQLM